MANNLEFFVTAAVLTGNTSVQLSQLALGILGNPNTVAKLRFGVYDSAQGLLGSTNEVIVTNPTDTTVVGVLVTPVLLSASTQYYLACEDGQPAVHGVQRQRQRVVSHTRRITRSCRYERECGKLTR